MAITIIATPKAANANSYATEAEADAYWEAHAGNTDWTNAGVEAKKAALVQATTMIDQLQFVGRRADVDQALAWPRWSVVDPDGYWVADTAIPAFVRKACCELAGRLLTEDRLADAGSLNLDEVEVGSIKVKFSTSDRSNPMPDSVLQFLSFYVTSGSMGGIGISRVGRS